ncbi:MAG TPA: phytanoyl-CoA dioxygenase family protein [Actinospica sp.]|jgi:ectoine hydroxylase|nr:phytanoyl-CoA dioxygenase family protein [Actinospica sp.]
MSDHFDGDFWAARAEEFHRDGAVLVPDFVSADLVRRMNGDLGAMLGGDWPHVYHENDGTTPRAVYGLHERGGAWAELTRLPQLAEAVERICGEPYYIFQWKINTKAPHGGEKWEWHRDFVYWQFLDGMPEARAVNVSIFLDDVTVETGPTRVVRGSHRIPLSERENALLPRALPTAEADGDLENFAAAQIPYYVPEDEVEKLGREHGFIEATGRAGSAFIFHSNVVHGSLPNLSDNSRNITFMTLNPVSNKPTASSIRGGHMVNTPTAP